MLRNFLSVVAGVLFILGWYFGWEWIPGSLGGWLKVSAFILGPCLTTLISTRYDLLHALIAALVAAVVLNSADRFQWVDPAKTNIFMVILSIFFLIILNYIGYFLGYWIKRGKSRR